MIQNLIDDKDCMFYLSTEKLNELLKKSDSKKDGIKEQIKQLKRNIDSKIKKKSKILDMFLEEKITEEEFTEQRENIDKEISIINDSLSELESLCDYEDIKVNTSKQISKLISEGKAEGFNKELFDLLVRKITIGGKVWDGKKYKDDPNSLHYELLDYNLSTDMQRVVRDGVLRYTMDGNLEREFKKQRKKKQ